MDQFVLGDSIILRPGEKYDELDLDMSGWRGRIVEISNEDGLLIAWDSQTLREMPETAVAQWLNQEIDWTCMFVEADAVLPYEPRDTILDGLTVARQRTAEYGFNFDNISDNPLYEDLIEEDWDDDEDWEEDWSPPYFDLDQFLYSLEIPAKEHPRIRRALSQGLGQYHFDYYGRYRFGKQPAHLIPESMGIPFIFGYGVLQILDHKQISQETKLKICQYALSTLDPIQEDGLLYGLLTILGYLAKIDQLPLSVFHYVMLNAEYGGIGIFRRSIWHFGVEREALLALLDWVAAHPEISQEEKLFWAWRWSLQSEFDSHLVKATAHNWLNQPNIPDNFKEEICWAWLREPAEVGTPPQIWQVMQAFMSGDRPKLEQFLADLGPEMPDLPISLDEMMPPRAEDREEGLFFQLMYGSRSFTLTPAPLKRLAIPALARLGQDPQTLAEMFWGSDYDYYTDAIHSGIADMLREFQDQIPTAELNRLVEKGLHFSRVNVRKIFHILARDLYGDEYARRYLHLALEDTAKSLRTWAKKQKL